MEIKGVEYQLNAPDDVVHIKLFTLKRAINSLKKQIGEHKHELQAELETFIHSKDECFKFYKDGRLKRITYPSIWREVAVRGRFLPCLI